MRAAVATVEHTPSVEHRRRSAHAAAGFLVFAGVALLAASGCAPTFVYRPAGPEFGGGAAAHYPIPPQRPAGEAYITSFGFSDIDVGGGESMPFMHARVALANSSNQPWTLDGREQLLVAAAGQPPAPPAFLNTDAGAGPVYTVYPGQHRVFDFYFSLPPPLNEAQNLAGYQLNWRINIGAQPVVGSTPFQRLEGDLPPPAGYPPYVFVGLGWGPLWWYGPYFPYRYHYYRPVVRGYYYPPSRGGGVVPPPRAVGGWRGTARGGWRGRAR